MSSRPSRRIQAPASYRLDDEERNQESVRRKNSNAPVAITASALGNLPIGILAVFEMCLDLDVSRFLDFPIGILAVFEISR